MSRFPQYLRQRHAAQDEANIQRATRTQVDEDLKVYVSTAAGDTRKLRGIPAIGRGVTGAIQGTSPHHHR
jgi:hypothetical protein